MKNQPASRLMRALAAISLLAASGFPSLAADDVSRAALGPWGVDLANMDKTIAPGDDFFMYVNGTWYRNAVIPPDRGRFGAFDQLRIESENRMKAIADELLARAPDKLSSDERKLRDLYATYLDEAGIAAHGLAPAQADFDLIAGAKTAEDVARIMGSPRRSVGGPFAVGIDVDDKDPDAYVLRLVQSGLGMPNRDYYLRDDEALVKDREAYKQHLTKVFTLLGLSEPEARAGKVYDLERRIADAQWNNVDRRDSEKTYNPMTLSELQNYAPNFPWAIYLKTAGVVAKKGQAERHLIVSEKSAFPVLAKIFSETPNEVWRDYMQAHYVHAYAGVLPKAFDEEDFAFYGQVLQGNAQQLPRKVRAVRLLDSVMGEALGRTYVARYFPPDAKAKAEALVGNLLKVYDADIRVLPWMSEATRQKALVKLHKFTPHIGYPDKWRNYSAYRVTRDDLLGDVQRGAEFEWNRELKRIDQRVDRSEWSMSPPTVNAYYTPSFNAIFFPAAILQPPFFDPHADDAVNYGGIGAVIGHEISHGFDDQGSKYDGDGKLDNWWTEEDRKAFDAATAALAKQFDGYEALPGLHVNGPFTLGENIADLSGLTVALKAYHLSLDGKSAPILDGFTGDQRLLLAFGQVWRTKIREGALRQQVLSDPHSPANFRTIGPTRNIDAWYDAFSVTPQNKYYLAPGDRVRLW